MKKRTIAFISLLILGALFLHILALLKLVSLYLSVPLLFLSLFLFISVLNYKKRFTGL